MSHPSLAVRGTATEQSSVNKNYYWRRDLILNQTEHHSSKFPVANQIVSLGTK